MLITQLDIVNACLASMGESPANSLNESNSFISSALSALAVASPTEQSFGWYFNMEKIVAHPTVDGEYYVPADVLGFVPNATPNTWVLRGRRVYDTALGGYLLGRVPMDVHIIRHVKVEDLPFHAARLIQAATVLQFQRSYDGDTLKISDAEKEYNKARAFLMSEHIRSVRANMLYQGNVGVRNALNRHFAGPIYRG